MHGIPTFGPFSTDCERAKHNRHMNTNERHLLNDLFITAEQRVELLLISVVHDRDSFLSNTTSPTDKNSEISIRRSEIAGQ